MDAIASQLLTDVLQKTSSRNGKFLTATDVYRIGLVIYNLVNQQNDQKSQVNIIMNTVETAALAVLQALPGNFRQGLFDDLHEALQQVILVQQQKYTAHDQEHLTRALESFIGIWSLLRVVSTSDKQQTTPRRRLEQRWPNEVEISQCFIELYSKPHVPKACQLLILEFLSLVWLLPTIHKDNSNKNTASSPSSSSSEPLEEFLTVLHSLQEQDTLWQDLILHHEQQQQSSSWRQELVQSLTQHSENDDATQRDYMSSLLQYEKAPETRSIVMPPSTAKPPSKGVVVQNTAKKDAMQERIDQVRAVIPNVGEGFVELALSLYQGDAERAITALLEPELPPGLQHVDKHLPRRKNPNAMTLNDEDAQVAKQVTKKALQAEEERQKAEAAALYYVSKTEEEEGKMKNDVYHHHDEYDDEYDDQWDADFAGTTAGADDGLYDRGDDYQAILAYNRAMKQVEGEQSFWDEQRNTNRKQSSSNAVTAEDGSTSSSYRGPDKIKGGRVPGRGRGGGVAAAGGGGGGGEGGRGGNKSAKGKKDSDVAAGGKGKNQGKAGATATSTTTSNNNDNLPSKPNQRHKANKLASRREKQKQSMNKRSGM